MFLLARGTPGVAPCPRHGPDSFRHGHATGVPLHGLLEEDDRI